MEWLGGVFFFQSFSELEMVFIISGSVKYIRSDVESGYVGSVCLASDIRGVRPRSQVYIE
jgi:hypothetical protein